MPRGGRLFLATCLGSLFVLVLYFQSITKPGKTSLILCDAKKYNNRTVMLFHLLLCICLTLNSEGGHKESKTISFVINALSALY